MTKTKKVVAIMLALLMMFSSFSVLATAWDATTDDGSALTIATKFFKEVDGEWVETTKVRPNDTVKARVYLGTDYYSNDSTLLFFYDKDFFTLGDVTNPDAPVLTVNNSSFATANKISASYNANPNVNSQVAKGYIDAAFLNDYSAVTANVHTESGENDSNIMYDNSDWLLEFTMTVNADASGEGDFFVKDTTVQSTTNDRGIVNVPKGPADGNDMDIWAMWLWDADVSLSSQPVTTISSVTFNANGGAYGDGTASKVIEDEIDAKIAADAVPVPELEGYTFMGWVDATDADPTLDEAAPAPTAIPENDLVLNAFWLKNVNITFDTDGGSAIAPIENVTPYTDFADVADPTKEGYTFVGWDVRGGDLPETYPDVDTTYTAIWALNVVVSFDTLGGTEIADVEGYEGDDFKAVIPNPTKEGHRFVKWDKELPTVFPEQDTTYTAIFESLTYVVTYIIEGEDPYEIELEYGAEIPTSLILAELPEGTEIKNWYTDAGYSNALAEGATMGAASITLYAKAENKTYNAIFMVDGAEYAVVPTVYGESIQIPVNPSKVGYEFAGWEPYPFEMEAKDMVFNASWVESEVNLKYWLDDSMSSDSVWYDGVIAYGEEIDIPAEPYKEGYDFIGWSKTPDGEVIKLEGMTMPAEALEFYAIFDVQKHKIIFNTDGGTEIETIRGDFGAEVIAPENPKKTGYTFAGWIDENGNPTEVPATMPAEDITLKATWTINQYTITFNTDGGSAVAPITQDYNTAVTAPEDPTKTGYTFAGWDAEIPATMPAENVTITAQWTVNQYTITFDTDGGSDVAPITQDYNTAVTAPAAPTKTGYTFAGWDVEVPATMPAENVTITAQWTINQYTITFDTVGGTEVAPITQDYNTAVTAPADPTKTGYTFAGWDVAVPATMPAENVTITAKWTVNQYTITFNTDGGTAVAPITQDYATAVTAPADPTKTGYTFAGWDVAVPATMPAENVTITAQWTINTYNVTWNVEGEKTVVPYEYGATINKIADPTKTGYTFNGWTPAVPATMPAEDIELTADFTVNSYKSTFMVDGEVYEVVTTAYGDDIVPPANPEKQGYEFSTWDPVPGKQDVANDDLVFNAVWVGSDDTTYTVKTYTMGTDGQYGEPVIATKKGTTDTEVDETPSVGTGFVFNAEDSEYKGTVAADNSLVLEIYIDRLQYNFIVKADENDEKPATEIYYFEQIVNAPEEPSKTGYVFAGWDAEIPATMPAENVTITAQWTINQYTITFDTVGGTAVAPITQDYATAVTAPADPTKTGYTFAGWDVEVPATMPAENVTITAKWTVNQYTITFDVDGGTDVAPITQDFGTAITAPAAPTKAGYSFAGWAPELPATMPAENITVKAQWTALDGVAYKVEIYKMNTEGNFDGVVPEIINKADKAGETVSYAPETITGFTFDEANADNVLEGVVAGDGSLVLKAYYNRDKVNVTINGKEEEYFYGEQITTPETPKAEEGYEFDKWVDENGDEVNFPITVPAEDIVITPVYNPLKYTTTWIAEGTQVAEFEVTYGEAVTAPEAPAKEGYRFVKWSPDVPATMPAKDMEFTAIYEVMSGYIVEYYVEGKLVESFSYMYGDTFVEYDYEAPMGYDFDGWYADAECSTEFDAPATVTAEFTKIYGKLVAKTFNATFNANLGQFADGSTSIDVPTVFDEQIVAPAAPTREGYVFAGWDNEVGLMDEEGKIFNASWIADSSLTATYIVDGDEENPYAVYEVAYGEDLDVPADPEKDGWEFLGWAETIDGEVVDLVGAKMPATSVKYYAIFKQSVAELVINEYEESEHGPAATPAPALVPMADYSGMVLIGSTVTLPSAEEMAIENYVFTGWVDNEGNVYAADAEITMPATGLELIPTYDRVQIKLVPVVGSTTVIERNGVTESYNDNTVTDVPYEEPANFSQYYIYGFTNKRQLPTEANLESRYITYTGDGRIEIIRREGMEGAPKLGTGTEIVLYDNVSNEEVERFYLIYFGDVDGDCYVTLDDYNNVYLELNSRRTWSALRGASRVPYMIKAANLDGQANIYLTDMNFMYEVVNGAALDQKVGTMS